MAKPESEVRVLVIGKDARTDAIAAACAASPHRPELYALAEMPIPGLVEKCVRVDIGSLMDRGVLAKVVADVQPGLVIIGPEEPLAAGFVDFLEEHKIPAFGPSEELAQIESSKSWARELVETHGIPGNPKYSVFHAETGLRSYMEELGSFVVKPDGLTAGKGVRVFGEHLHSVDEAFEYARDLVAQDGRVLIEERLEGQEFSLQTITDGSFSIHCPLVQDHKRAFEGDQGPNTGGMGSYTCPDFSLPFLEPSEVAEAQSINEAVIEAIAQKTGKPYRGVLYGGFMATREGVRLIEYNCRFGDPEAMNVLSILKGDFLEICWAAATDGLKDVPCAFESKATVCKYLVPKAYPSPSEVRAKIVVPPHRRNSADLKWYWAACEQRDAEVYLTSSRSGAFVGIGDSLQEAESAAEVAAQEIEAGSPVRHRKDIGRAHVIQARVEHMESLRARVLGLGA